MASLPEWALEVFMWLQLFVPTVLCLGASGLFAFSERPWIATPWGRTGRLIVCVLVAAYGIYYLYQLLTFDAELIFLYVFTAAPAGGALLILAASGYKTYSIVEKVVYGALVLLALVFLVGPFVFFNYRTSGGCVGRENSDPNCTIEKQVEALSEQIRQTQKH